MASDVVAAAAHISAPALATGDPVRGDDALTNGASTTQEQSASAMAADPVPADDHTLPTAETTLNFKDQKDASPSAPAVADPISSQPAAVTPVESASAGGIAPVAGFLPKDAPSLSHPTPPPDQPLSSTLPPVDSEMEDVPAVEPAAEELTQQVESVTAPAPVDQILSNGDAATAAVPNEKPASPAPEPEPSTSLVRPREEDEVDEPAAKRSKVKDDSEVEPMAVDPSGPVESVAPAAVAAELISTQEPAPLETSSAQEAAAVTTEPTTPAPAPALDTSDVRPSVETGTETTTETAAGASTENALGAAPPTSSARQFSTAPITNPQKVYLSDKMKNVKKTKAAIAFLAPVDPVALNIPTYLDIVKTPMDLSTMEQKLKANQYTSVQDFVNDFNQIVSNTVRFNGEQHPVTIAARNVEAYFNKILEGVPSADQTTQKKPPKKASPKPAPPPRRESRAAAQASPTETFALQADGTPQIRRDSTMNRPARAIKPPQNRELTYAKPKRKEHQLELRFCEHVLDELSGPSFGNINHVFQVPVDPVALNIPQYRQIVKHPMDLSTIRQKLKTGQYAKASEFVKDFRLMIENCLVFNPPGNPVRDLGVQFRREFDRVWADKDKWEKKNAPSSNRASSASAEESEAEQSEEEAEVEDPMQNETLKALTKQLAEIQSQIGSLSKAGATKAKKPKPAKPAKKTAAAAVPKPAKKAKAAAAAAPKRAKPVTYDEKQEISQAVEKMNGAQVEKLTQIIMERCEKYRNMGDDMELEIDDLPNDVQLLLLQHVRGIFGAPARAKKQAQRAPSPDDAAAVDDDDFEPENRRGGKGGARTKKHKPMKREQQAQAIDNIRSQIANLTSTGVSGATSQSPSSNYANQQESSGDEESEESEEE